MGIRRNQYGFAALELALVVVVLTAVAGAGWWVYQKHNTTPTNANTMASTAPAVSSTGNTAQASTAKNVSSAPQVTSVSDLDSALTTLNRNDPSTANSGDSSQLSSQSSF